MNYELISEADYASLPLEPAAKWLALEAKCRGNLNELITNSSEAAADRTLRLQYMNIVASAADALGISGIDVSPSTEVKFEPFIMAVTRTSTRLRLEASSSNHALSVALRRPTRAKIHDQIERLRRGIAASDLPPSQKKKLAGKLDELQSLVIAQRTDFGKVMVLLSAIAATAINSTSFLADIPDAVGTITALIGFDKEEEEEEQRLLEAEKKQLQLPDLRKQMSDDDEIPF